MSSALPELRLAAQDYLAPSTDPGRKQAGGEVIASRRGDVRFDVDMATSPGDPGVEHVCSRLLHIV